MQNLKQQQKLKARNELIILLLINTGLFIWFAQLDLMEQILEWFEKVEAFELDELFPVFGTLIISFLFYSIRRWRDFRNLADLAEKLASIDGLTQIQNRRALQHIMNTEISRADRNGEALCVLLIDVDNFKSINDVYGHQKGDEILIKIGQILKDNTRTVDGCGRWGGEEFLIVCPMTTSDDAQILADKILNKINNIQFESVTMSASIGIAQHRGAQTSDFLIHRADDALYHSKRNGKNQATLAH